MFNALDWNKNCYIRGSQIYLLIIHLFIYSLIYLFIYSFINGKQQNKKRTEKNYLAGTYSSYRTFLFDVLAALLVYF